MSRKHFEAFAAAIKSRLDNGTFTLQDAQSAANVVIDVSVESNDRFDTRRFLAACGL